MNEKGLKGLLEDKFEIGGEGSGLGAVSNVSVPRMRVYRPTVPNGAAVLPELASTRKLRPHRSKACNTALRQTQSPSQVGRHGQSLGEIDSGRGD